MDITPATIDDALGIATVHVRTWQTAYAGILGAEFLGELSIEARAARWQDILQRRDSQTLVARQATGIVGFVSHGRWRDAPDDIGAGEIWAIYVVPEAWGTGVGRALLDAGVRELRAAGRRSVFLWVLERNDRGVRFYERFGFRAVPGRAKTVEIGGRRVEEICLRLEPDA